MSAVVDPGDATWGVETHEWPNVSRVNVHHGPIASAVRRVAARLPHPIGQLIRSWFPGPFLPHNVVVKVTKPDWEDEFDNEVMMYHKLQPVQGVVVPVFHGIISVSGRRALLLSDVGGKQLLAVTYSERGREELRAMLGTALRAIYELGISPYDANLLNCHVVNDRIVVVDHEQDEELEQDLRHRVDELVEGKADSVMRRHWEVHKPVQARDRVAENKAHEAWMSRNRHLLP